MVDKNRDIPFTSISNEALSTLDCCEGTLRVLVIEDDQRLARALRRVLEEERYVVDEAHDGIEGEDLAMESGYDFIVLDVMLPGRDGIAVCKNLRRGKVATPILMLTAKDTVQDRVTGLDAGADDYLVKPFASMELLARLRSLSRRRTDELSDMRLEADGLVMDLVRHQVHRDGKEIELTAREFALLEYFLRHQGQALTRTQILSAVWRYDTEVVSNVVDIYVHYLREKIDRGARHPLIRTIRGVGYSLRA
jgi:DNA-binding response OmpR family regulator